MRPPEATHPLDCGYCIAGEPMVHNYEPVSNEKGQDN